MPLTLGNHGALKFDAWGVKARDVSITDPRPLTSRNRNKIQSNSWNTQES